SRESRPISASTRRCATPRRWAFTWSSRRTASPRTRPSCTTRRSRTRSSCSVTCSAGGRLLRSGGAVPSGGAPYRRPGGAPGRPGLGPFRLFHERADRLRAEPDVLLEHLAGDLGLARQRGLHDDPVLLVDARRDLAVGHEAAAIALGLVIENFAEMEKPGRAARRLERGVECAVAPLPFVRIGRGRRLHVLDQLVELVVGGDDPRLPDLVAAGDRPLEGLGRGLDAQ